MGNMGLQFGLASSDDQTTLTQYGIYKRKFRWLFKIQDVSASQGVPSLPPSQAARPNINFREQEARHLTEVVYFPVRPDWKPIQLILYDLVKKNGETTMHPVFEWLKQIYNTNATTDSKWNPPADQFIKSTADLNMLDGCGNVIESWVFEDIWPQVIDFGRLDMGSNDVVTCDLTLRYARAYIA